MYRLIFLALSAYLTCQFAAVAYGARQSDRLVITMWHRMLGAEREALEAEIRRFQQLYPEIEVRALYKDGVKSAALAFESAALVGDGPELFFGLSDSIGRFQTTRVVQDMTPWFSERKQQAFVNGSLIKLPVLNDPSRAELLLVGDRIGNHLALVYNQDFVPEPPKTTDELITVARQQTVDQDRDGRPERFGLVWNYGEPYFAVPFLSGCGAWLFDESLPGVPKLDTPEATAAYALIDRIVNRERVAPRNCDYETADALFKSGKAAMIINGDWSWRDYLDNPELNAAIAVLPNVSSTGRPMRPMVAPKGYSLNANAKGERADAAMVFVQYMTSEDVQRRSLQRLRILSSRRALYEEALASSDETLAISAKQVERSRPMPVGAELRGIWDAMRPALQALLAEDITPEQCGQRMQRLAERRIAELNPHSERQE